MAYPEILRRLITLDYLEQLETQEYYACLQPIRAGETPVLKRLNNGLADELCELLAAREQFGYIQGFMRAVTLLEKGANLRALEGIPEKDIDRMEAKAWQ